MSASGKLVRARAQAKGTFHCFKERMETSSKQDACPPL